MTWSVICDHEYVHRINKDFVKCATCGETIVYAQKPLVNKKPIDFIQADPSFMKSTKTLNNSRKQQTNTNTGSNSNPNYYYTDRTGFNAIAVNGGSNKISINGKPVNVDSTDLKNWLNNIKAIRVDKATYENLLIKNKKLTK
jgi:endogenous inhibitor of DNA gyrase (YacG/DUF329 family)